jgi:flagellar motor switch protein FliG
MAGGATTALTRTTEYEELGGRQKAAILCMALGAETAAKITAQLSPEEAEIISFEIARIDQVGGETAQMVLDEWLESIIAADSLSAGGVDFARSVLERAFGPQKASSILKRIQGQLAETADFQRLKKADPAQLATTLRGEHPQTIALILAHLPAKLTAAVLRELVSETGSEVVLRMARMEKVSPEMLVLLERSFGNDDLSFTQGMSAAGGPAAVAEVLNLMNATQEKELLDRVAIQDAELVEQIKNLMFVFEDVTALDQKSIARVLREVESKQLALALKAASVELKEKIMRAMSQRAVQGLLEEMEMMGPVRMRDVEAAQADIVSKIRELEEQGEIVLSSGGGDDAIVE